MKARNPERRTGHRLGTLLRVLAVGLFAAMLAGCEESQACFPINSDCSDAAGFSLFFQSNVPCCEGTCTTEANPDPPPATRRFCR